MTLSSIRFKNYKAFSETETLELRPVTLLIGKNSSGKSSVLKLLALIQYLLSGGDVPFKLNVNGLSLGSRYADLFHNFSLSDFSIGVSFSEDVDIDATYLVNQNTLYRYDYHLRNGERTAKRVITDDSSNNGYRYNGLIDNDLFGELGLHTENVRFNMDYIGPLRVRPERNVDFGGLNVYQTVGIDGGNTYNILLDSYLQDGVLFQHVSKWMEQCLEGQRMVAAPNGPSSGSYSFLIDRYGCRVNIADVGLGLSQVLPIIVESFVPVHNKVVAIEQPVLHLHPADHACVAYRLAESALQYGKKYVVETHSENFLLGLRNMVSDKKHPLSSKDVIIYFVDTDGEAAFLKPIEILSDGQLTSWPEGVFGESFELMSQIIQNSNL